MIQFHLRTVCARPVHSVGLAVALLSCFIAGCGGGSNSNPSQPATSNGLTVSCAPGSVSPGQTSQCTAKGLTVGHVAAWSASGGSVSPAGVLTAPASRAPVTVTAKDALDTTKS